MNDKLDSKAMSIKTPAYRQTGSSLKMNHYQAYPEYKDSGVEWLGEIPTSWELRRLGAYFQERRTKVSDKDFTPLSVTKQGILPQLESAAKTNDGDNRKLVRKGDFVINSRSDRKGSSGIALQEGSVSLINIVIEPQGIHPPFCNYLLKGNAFIEEFYRNGHGIVADLWTTRYDEMKNIKIGMPNEDEQIAIANFLDDKVSKIDEAIAQKEQLIALLKERKQIMIQNAVTCGLDENGNIRTPPTCLPAEGWKDSGVEWLGEIPSSWKVLPLYTLMKFRSGSAHEPYVEETGKYICVNSRFVSTEGKTVKRCTENNTPAFKNDILMVMSDLPKGRALAKAYFVKTDTEELAVNQRVCALSTYKGIAKYFFYYLDRNLGLLEKDDGWNQTHLSNDNYRKLKVLFPPLNEQIAIARFLDDKVSKIDEAIAQAKAQIAKLKEYKASLINSAVTGEIMVSY